MNASLVRRVGAPLVVAACLWSVAPPGSAFAAEPPAQTPSPPQLGDADRLFEQGVAARKAGKLAEAETFFLQAWAIKKTWDIAANLGLVEFKLVKLAEGAEHVSYAIANLPPTESDTTRESLTKALAQARPDIGELTIQCDVDGAELRVGGKLKGALPLATSLFSAPGQLTIEVSKEGYAPASKTIDVQKGSTQKVSFTLVKDAPPASSNLPAYVAFGVGGAGLVLGAVAAGVAAAKTADLKKVCGDALTCPPSERGNLDGATTLAHVSTVGFVLAGVGAAVGVTLLLVPIGQKTKAQARVVIGPAFVGVKGAF